MLFTTFFSLCGFSWQLIKRDDTIIDEHLSIIQSSLVDLRILYRSTPTPAPNRHHQNILTVETILVPDNSAEFRVQANGVR